MTDLSGVAFCELGSSVNEERLPSRGQQVRHAVYKDIFGVVVGIVPPSNDSPPDGERVHRVRVLWSTPIPTNKFTNFQLPNIRKAAPQQLVANSLVSIQPMTLPSGLIFYLDYQYGSGSKDVP